LVLYDQPKLWKRGQQTTRSNALLDRNLIAEIVIDGSTPRFRFRADDLWKQVAAAT
jgi:hypothetical protein